MSGGDFEIALTGDLVLDEPDAAYWLSGIAPALKSADLAIGHLEVPHGKGGTEMQGDVPAPCAPLDNLAAFSGAGIGMLSLAGNHIADCGAEGIAQTISELDGLGIVHCGAGATLDAARRPALARLVERTVALLSYNCVGPESGWATDSRAGCAYLPLGTRDGEPVSPRARIETILSQALDILRDDLASARREADVVIVALHKGIVHTPALLAPYERALAQACIDLGADAVVGHHAHIARGIEFHRGRPIFHGLGNGCVVTRALSPDQDHEARREWAQRRKEMFNFEPDPAYSLAPFHPEAVNALIGRLRWRNGRFDAAAMTAVFVEPPGRPVLADAERAPGIRRYIETITSKAGLPAINIDPDGAIHEAC